MHVHMHESMYKYIMHECPYACRHPCVSAKRVYVHMHRCMHNTICIYKIYKRARFISVFRMIIINMNFIMDGTRLACLHGGLLARATQLKIWPEKAPSVR